jgi:hypothetical protein
MTGTMIDTYRQPAKLMTACEKLLELILAQPLPEYFPLSASIPQI